MTNDERPDSDADRAVARSVLALTGARQDACPDLDAIVGWHERRLDAARMRDVEAHVAHCDRCFVLWRGLAAAADADPRRAGAPARATRWWQVIAPRLRAPALLGAAVASAAFLAVVGVYMLGPAGPGGAPLPHYALEFQGRALMRGGEPGAVADAPVVLTPGTRFELMLRPDTAVADDVGARAWLERAGTLTPLDTTRATTMRGVVALEGVVGTDWPLPEGESDLVVVVGRTAALPDGGEAMAALAGGTRAATDDWTAWRVPVRVGD
jgi:hypothetical protein